MVFNKEETLKSVDLLIGSKLRHQRKLCGISQEQLAQHLNVSFQQIQKYEAGLNRITASRLWKAAEFLSVPVSSFFEELEHKSSFPQVLSFHENTELPVSDSVQQKEILELVHGYMKIEDPQLRHSVLHMVKSLSSDKAAKPQKKKKTDGKIV